MISMYYPALTGPLRRTPNSLLFINSPQSTAIGWSISTPPPGAPPDHIEPPLPSESSGLIEETGRHQVSLCVREHVL